jgi:hypothetical protein
VATVGPVAGHIYEVDGFQRGFPVVIGAVGVVAGIVALVIGEAPGLILLAVGGWSLFEFGFWAPHRVTLDDSGVLLQAAARRIRIPWDELESVEPAPWDIRRQMLRWGRSRGLAVMTLNAFPELHRILVEIERRAPQAVVSS